MGDDPQQVVEQIRRSLPSVASVSWGGSGSCYTCARDSSSSSSSWSAPIAGIVALILHRRLRALVVRVYDRSADVLMEAELPTHCAASCAAPAFVTLETEVRGPPPAILPFSSVKLMRSHSR